MLGFVMQPTRRQFAVAVSSPSVLAAGGRLLARATPGPVRQSLEAFSADPARVASLRNGVAAMKVLPATDKRSWFFWAATHAYSDALFDAETRRDPKLKAFDAARYWNKCPHFGQSSAKDWGPLPPSKWFDERPWPFADENGNDITVSRREAIAMLAAYDKNYSRQIAMPPAPAKTEAPRGGSGSNTALPPMVGAASPEGGRRSGHRRPAERELLADANPLTVSPRRTERRHLTPVTTLEAPAFAESARVLLELANIAFSLVPSSGFAVYLDTEGAAPTTEPVGLIDIFGATHHATAGMTMPAAQRFDVTAILRGSNGPFTLRIEPYSLLVTRDQRPARARTDAVTIGKVHFVVLD
jgi:hypothetical protein